MRYEDRFDVIYGVQKAFVVFVEAGGVEELSPMMAEPLSLDDVSHQLQHHIT